MSYEAGGQQPATKEVSVSNEPLPITKPISDEHETRDMFGLEGHAYAAMIAIPCEDVTTIEGNSPRRYERFCVFRAATGAAAIQYSAVGDPIRGLDWFASLPPEQVMTDIQTDPHTGLHVKTCLRFKDLPGEVTLVPEDDLQALTYFSRMGEQEKLNAASGQGTYPEIRAVRIKPGTSVTLGKDADCAFNQVLNNPGRNPYTSRQHCTVSVPKDGQSILIENHSRNQTNVLCAS